jgi:hypothetical protein
MKNFKKITNKNGEIDQQLLRYNALLLTTVNKQKPVFLPLAEDIINFVNTGDYNKPLGLEEETIKDLLPHRN